MPSAFQRVDLLEGDNNKEMSSCKIQKDSRSVANSVGAAGFEALVGFRALVGVGESCGSKIYINLSGTAGSGVQGNPSSRPSSAALLVFLTGAIVSIDWLSARALRI